MLGVAAVSLIQPDHVHAPHEGFWRCLACSARRSTVQAVQRIVPVPRLGLPVTVGDDAGVAIDVEQRTVGRAGAGVSRLAQL
jgi:hypothetical protein